MGSMASCRQARGTGGPAYGEILDIPRVPRLQTPQRSMVRSAGTALHRQSGSLIQAGIDRHGVHGAWEGRGARRSLTKLRTIKLTKAPAQDEDIDVPYGP